MYYYVDHLAVVSLVKTAVRCRNLTKKKGKKRKRLIHCNHESDESLHNYSALCLTVGRVSLWE